MDNNIDEQKEFKLAKLRKLKPNGIICEDGTNKEIDLFFLTMALIYNDIKGFVYFDNYICSHRTPDQGETSGHAGEFTGIKIQIFRIVSSCILEIIKFIEENKSIVLDSEFQTYLRKLSIQDYNIWNLLFNIATNNNTSKFDDEQNEKFKKLLEIIRNNITFHYYQSGKPLVKGFRRHFFKSDLKIPANEVAYYSLRQSDFYENRFYYVDAALGSYLNEYIEEICDGDQMVQVIFDLSAKISKVIAGLLEEYLHQKPYV